MPDCDPLFVWIGIVAFVRPPLSQGPVQQLGRIGHRWMVNTAIAKLREDCSPPPLRFPGNDDTAPVVDIDRSRLTFQVMTGSGDFLWRVRSSTIAIIVACLAVTVVLMTCLLQTDRHGVELISKWVNVGGAGLTFIGLTYAYLRSNTRLRAWFALQWHRLRVGPTTRTGHAGPITIGVEVWAEGSIQASFAAADKAADPIARLTARTDRLLELVNAMEKSAVDTRSKVRKLRSDLAQARTEAQRDSQQTAAAAAAALSDFADELKRADSLDLRWAIAGTFFSMLGGVLTIYS